MAITYQGAGTPAANTVANTTLSVDYPVGILAGDVLVLVVGVSGAAPTNPTGAGFTSAITTNSGGGSPAYRVSYKVANGTETGSLAVTTVSQTSQGRMFLFRGVDNTTPLDVAGDVFGTATATTSYFDTVNHHPALTTTVAGVALVYCGISNSASGTWTPPTVPAAFTEVWDSATATPSSTAGYLIWSGSGATGDIDLTRSAAVRGAAGVIALRPASTGTAASGTAQLDLAASGSAAGVGSGTGALSLSGSGTAAAPVTGSGSLTLGATGNTGSATAATGTGSLTLGGSGAASASTAATGALSLAGSGSAAARVTGSGSLALSGSGTARAVIVSTASLSLAAAAQAAATAGGTAALVLTGTGSASGPTFADPYPWTATVVEQATATAREQATATVTELATSSGLERATATVTELATTTQRSI